MVIGRRGFLGGLLGTSLVAPAIIRTPGLIMPVRPPRLKWTASCVVHDIESLDIREAPNGHAYLFSYGVPIGYLTNITVELGTAHGTLVLS